MPKTNDLDAYMAMAEAGDAKAQIFVGWAYLEGKLVEKNLKIAENWLRKASGQGSFEGGYRLAMMLLQRGDREAIDLLTRLGDQGYSPANYELGNCLYTGDLIDRNAREAAVRWDEAQRKGHIVARIKL
ncbi:MAG: sel1 repeat family protein, partial [Mesorhizobium sp.]